MGRADALGLMHRTKVRRTGRRERNTGTGDTELDEERIELDEEEKGTK